MSDQVNQPPSEPTVDDAEARLERETAPKEQPVVPEEEPIVALPEGGLVHWAKENLFGSVKDTILTIVFGAILGWLGLKALNYAFLTGRWEVVVNGPLEAYMVGNRFAATGLSYTNIWGAIFLLAVASGVIAGVSRAHGNRTPRKTAVKILAAPVLGLVAVLAMTRTITPTLLVLATIAIFLVTRAVTPRLPQAALRRAGWGVFALTVAAFLVLVGGEPANVNRFGGLLLTIIVSAGGIVLSFPIGVLMALARRSSFPLIRPIAVAYIELIRGVPLITLLFMGQFALGLFFPPGTAVPGAIPRAIIMITLFTGAYVAEVVRGGLQSVPRGQTEGAQSLGLPPLKVTRLIVLPQALRNSIPALIGQFISLLKDTSLLVIIGVQDLLGITEPILAQLDFKAQGYQPEAFAFVSLIYWVITFSMSRASQRLEARLGVGTR